VKIVSTSYIEKNTRIVKTFSRKEQKFCRF